MAAVQTTIPFPSRKNRAFINSDNKKAITSSKKRRVPLEKACRSSHDDSSGEESCSPTKISRLAPRYDKAEDDSAAPNPRQALQSAAADVKLPSREAEIAELSSFLGEHLEQQTSGTMYVSGQPGTGKTACLSYILQLPKFKNGFKEVYVNCTMVKSAGSIYLRVCRELGLRPVGSSAKACLSAIDAFLATNHKMVLLVLDEIDQLDSKKQSVLYTIFEWPSRPSSRVVLVGVANALDLTDRVLPRLQARVDLRPRLMHFPPYTKEQIVHIFTEKLTSEGAANIFSPIALQMLAAKISAISGDMRRALDIGRRVIELATRSHFAENRDVTSLVAGAEGGGVTVELQQVLSVLGEVYGGEQQLQTEVHESFPMQQKLLICSLVLMLTKGHNKDITVGKLYDVYKRVASKRNMAVVDSAEFFSLCALVETRGLLRVRGGAGGKGGAGGARRATLTLQRDTADLAHALHDKRLLADILADVDCLARC